MLLREALTKWSVILPPGLDLRVLLKFVELIQGHQMTVTFWWLRAVLLSATLLTTWLAIVLFSSCVLFSQCRSCKRTAHSSFVLFQCIFGPDLWKDEGANSPRLSLEKQNIHAKEVYPLKTAGNSFKVLARAVLKKVVAPSTLVALSAGSFQAPIYS